MGSFVLTLEQKLLFLQVIRHLWDYIFVGSIQLAVRDKVEWFLQKSNVSIALEQYLSELNIVNLIENERMTIKMA